MSDTIKTEIANIEEIAREYLREQRRIHRENKRDDIKAYNKTYYDKNKETMKLRYLSASKRRLVEQLLVEHEAKCCVQEEKNIDVPATVPSHVERDVDIPLHTDAVFAAAEQEEEQQCAAAEETVTNLENVVNAKSEDETRLKGFHSGVVSTEYVYLLQEVEHVRSGQNIYKIGRTSASNYKRFGSYKKGFVVKLHCECIDSVIAEKELLQLFRDKFAHDAALIGKESFQGDVEEMIDIITLYVRTQRQMHALLQKTRQFLATH